MAWQQLSPGLSVRSVYLRSPGCFRPLSLLPMAPFLSLLAALG